FLARQNYRGGFTERGAQALSLVTDGANTLSLQGALGVRVARDIRITKTFLVTPELSTRWVHEFGDNEALLDARLAGAPSGSFTVYSDRFDRDSGVLSLGITGKVKDDWSFFLAYDAQVRVRETVHSATGGVKFKW
ncbi:MAG: autotransporter outer membrane beta-barrel domain-containing protein, partial [Syntrophorhabdaceae bacterium]|nr:autotransporter outer membrane beta-barrel domain-containing protein [Syntrophorhabdaceae bacterium]